MNVTPNSRTYSPNQLAPAPWSEQWSRLRQRRQASSEKTAAMAADEPLAEPADLAPTMPSWPRIFPGL